MASQLIISQKKCRSFYGSEIKILSPAKLNLYLNILGKYPSGFHRIESIAERISLCDEITLKVKKDSSINITSNCKELKSKDNICLKAAELIKNKFKIPLGVDIFLDKNIPIGAGLGGGSSNAASVILGLNKLFKLNLKKKNLYTLGKKLGSDVNFFLSDCKFAFLEQRGEKIKPLSIDKKFYHYIIWPSLSVSTEKVYKNKRVKLTNFFSNVNILRYALSKGDISLVKKCTFNALERKAFSAYRALSKVKDYLKRQGLTPLLTGSGSAFYTLSMAIPMKKLKDKLPNNWFLFRAHTF